MTDDDDKKGATTVMRVPNELVARIDALVAKRAGVISDKQRHPIATVSRSTVLRVALDIGLTEVENDHD